VIANPSALFNTTVDMSQHERASLLVTGHAGQVCLWDISNPFALDLLHCILLPKSDIKVTALHVEVSTGLISIAVGCDSGDTYVYQSHLSKLDSSAEAVEDSEEIGPFRRVFSMPMHVSPIQSIAYWPSVHRLAVGDRDGVFSLSDSVSGEALSYEILNASHTDMEDLIITSLGVLHLQHKLAVMVGLSSGRLLGYDLQSGQALFDYVPHVVKKGAPKMDQSIRLCCLIDSHNGRVISLSELSALSSQHINPSPSPVVSDQPAADPGAPEPLVAQPGECVPPVSNGAASSIGQGLLLVAAGQTISLHTLVSPAPMHKEKPVAPFRFAPIYLFVQFSSY
jgi:WD40 repeat protein